MPLYRCYFLDEQRRVVDHRLVKCDTDDAARAFADGLLSESVYSMIEVWEAQRQVFLAPLAAL